MKKQESGSLQKKGDTVYKVIIRDRALKQLATIPKKFAEKIDELILPLSQDPYPHGAKKLQGYENIYRIRYADYRVVYAVEDKKLIVEVIQIANRKDIYKKL